MDFPLFICSLCSPQLQLFCHTVVLSAFLAVYNYSFFYIVHGLLFKVQYWSFDIWPLLTLLVLYFLKLVGSSLRAFGLSTKI